MSWTKEDGKMLTRTTSGGDKGDQLIIKRVQPDDEGQWWWLMADIDQNDHNENDYMSDVGDNDNDDDYVTM